MAANREKRNAYMREWNKSAKARAWRREYRKRDDVATKESNIKKEWHAKNRERLITGKRERYQGNKELINAQNMEWKRRNPEKMLAYQKKWRDNNKQTTAAASMRRIASKIKATPKWVNKFFIDEAYDLAKMRSDATGITWHVDHIVPLHSKFVCGLHCEFNLQVIPGAENVRKGNRIWPGMPA